jgi:hypothetical protein
MFRLAAQAAMQSKTAVGAFIRRLRARLGAPTAINAGANKLARLFYRMLKFGAAYVEQVKPTMNKGTKSACYTISANGQKNSAFNSPLSSRLRFRFLRRSQRGANLPVAYDYICGIDNLTKAQFCI